MTSRKAALDKFILKLINHSILSQSEELKSFLTDRDEKLQWVNNQPVSPN